MQRLQYARDSLKNIFPIDTKSFLELAPEQVSRTDQLIYRFSQLQDTIGNKLFPLILEGLGEYTPNMPFIDILNTLEKLSIIEGAEQWLSLREIRNLVTHEYSGNEQEMVDALNELNTT
jgi:hypothetical protein